MGFDQGLSGLNSAAKNLDVIGNNVANTSTVGFKASRAEFADAYAASVFGVSNVDVGIGAKMTEVAQEFNQGNISVTNNPLDLAISGDGFFQLDQSGLATYTRNGQFQMDKSGFIVDSAGRRLTGNLATAAGVVIGGPPVDLQVSLGVAPPNVTTTSQLSANLDATSTAPNTGTAAAPVVPAIAPGTPSTYNYSTTFTVYDKKGTAQGLTLYFQKDAITAGQWNVAGYIGNNQVLPAPTTVAFAADGTVATINGAVPPAVGALLTTTDTTAIAAPNTGTMTPFSLDLAKLTQYGTSSGVSSVTQDGYSAGQFASLSVDKTGLVQGRYTNGQTLTLGQILLTNFLNPNGLQALGDNQWAETSAAGKQNSNAPGNGILGDLQSGAVEESNVDLTSELVNMIVAQRMYQANAQGIKAQDTVLQTLVNL